MTLSSTTIPGILELDIPQHSDIVAAQQGCDGHEFREMSIVRWQSVDCSATEFTTGGNRMRTSLFEVPRTIKLLISITINASHSAEDVRKAILVAMMNVHGIDSAKSTGNLLLWKQVIVLLIGSVDEMKPEVVGFLARMGIYRTDGMGHIKKPSVGQTFETTILLQPSSASKKLTPSPSPCQLALFNSHSSLTPEGANRWILSIASAFKAEIWVPLQAHQTDGIPETAFANVLNEFRINERYLSMTIKDYASSGIAMAQILSPFSSREDAVDIDRNSILLKEVLEAENKACAYRLSLDSLPVSLTFE